MNRRGARAGLLAGVVVALVALGYIVGQTLVRRRPSKAVADVAMLPEVSQRITDFRRVKVRDGRKVWELSASEAEYFEDQGQVLVRSPQVSFFDEQGGSIRVTGREGRVYLKGKDLERMELQGGVEVMMPDYVLRTEQAIYEQEHETVVSPGRVEVSGSTMLLDGNLMILLLKTQTMQVLNHVTTTFRRSVEDPDQAKAPLPSVDHSAGGGEADAPQP